MNLDDLRAPVAAYLARCVRTERGCLVNPNIQQDQYGEIRIGRQRRIPAHRAVAAVTAGRLPDRAEVARHRCDNKPCVEPTHILLGTQSQNIGDLYERNRRSPDAWRRGEDRPQALMTEHMVCEMRRLARAGMTLGRIVEQFGTSYSSTRMAIRGETWAHVDAEPPVPGRKNRKPNPRAYRYTRTDEARRAIALKSEGLSLDEIGRRLGVSRHTAWKLTQVGAAA